MSKTNPLREAKYSFIWQHWSYCLALQIKSIQKSSLPKYIVIKYLKDLLKCLPPVCAHAVCF